MAPHRGSGPSAASKLAVAERRQRVAAAYCRGLTQWQIAREEGVDQSQVSRDLAELRKAWLESARANFSQRKADELARWDQLEVTYWQAWERSCRPARKNVKKRSKEPDGRDEDGQPRFSEKTERGRHVEGRDGNPAFLAGVERCIEGRQKILDQLDLTAQMEALQARIAELEAEKHEHHDPAPAAESATDPPGEADARPEPAAAGSDPTGQKSGPEPGWALPGPLADGSAPLTG